MSEPPAEMPAEMPVSSEILTVESAAGPLSLIAPAWTLDQPAVTIVRHALSRGALIAIDAEDLARVLGTGRRGRLVCGRPHEDGAAAARSAIEALAAAGWTLAEVRRLAVVIAAPSLKAIDEVANAVADGCHPETEIHFGAIGDDAVRVCLIVPAVGGGWK